MREMAVCAALVLVFLPPALGTSEATHSDRFTAGGVLGVQELHQYRVHAARGAVLAATVVLASVADIDLVLLRESAQGCNALGCGVIVAHRMEVLDPEMHVEIEVPATGTYILEVEAWAAGPGAAYTITVSVDGAAPALVGPERFLGVLGPDFYVHKSEDVVAQLVP